MRPFIINWLAPDTTLIAETQSGGAGNLTIRNKQTEIFDFQYRAITLTCDVISSSANFTITGRSVNGTKISETITGPDLGTVSTTNYFKDIISVTSDNSFPDVSVGIGPGGVSDLLSQQLIQIGSAPYTVGAVVTGTIEYTVSSTLQPYYTILKGPQSLLMNNYDNLTFDPLNADWTDANISQQESFYNYPSTAIQLTATNDPANTGSLQLTYLSGGF